MKRLFKNKEGSVSVIVTVIFTVLLIICAFVIDFGNVAVKKAEFQNAMDSAALAAANELPDTVSALAAANKYIEANGFNASDISVSFSYDNKIVNITGNKKIEYGFAKIIGLNEATIERQASGTKGQIGNAFNYSLFSGSQTVSLNMNGSYFEVGGSTHTNNYFYMNTSTASITGVCSASRLITINGSYISIPNRLNNAPIITMPLFSDTLKEQAQQAGTVYNSSKSYNQTTVILNSPIYVNGNVTFNTIKFSGKGCVVATGSITFNGSSLYSSPSDSVCFYSTGGNININGSNIVFDGILYAPNGSININASSVTVNGRVIGNTLAINTSIFKVFSSDRDLDSLPPGPTKLIK